MNRASLWLILLVALSLVVISRCQERTAVDDAVDLTPNDSQRLATIAVSDGDEAALLQQQLGLHPVRVEGTTLYFRDDPKLREQLEAIGYTLAAANPYQVYERLVRISRRGSEDRLTNAGLQIINRERGYWVVRGNLAQLQTLKDNGYRLRKIGANEPRPREIRVTVNDYDQVRAIIATHADVYTVKQGRKGFSVYAGAFDYQIDQIRALGLPVEITDTLHN
jgi:hypothetical protein